MVKKKTKSTGYKGRKGTHGSISKAGKTRDMNRPFWKRDDKGKRLHHTKKHHHPRLSNRKKYNRRVIHATHR